MRQREKHVIAILREVIGHKQESFAALVGCKPSTIQSIEVNDPKRLKLSEKLAEKISEQTGVAMEWLLANNPEFQIIGMDGKNYSAKTFDEWRANIEFGKCFPDAAEAQVRMAWPVSLQAQLIVLDACLSATLQRKGFLAMYRVHRMLEDLSDEFGSIDEEAVNSIQQKIVPAMVTEAHENWVIEIDKLVRLGINRAEEVFKAKTPSPSPKQPKKRGGRSPRK